MRCDNAGEKSKVAEDNIIPTGPPVDGNALIQQEILKEYEEKEARRRQNNPTRVNATMQKIYSDIARAELEPPMPDPYIQKSCVYGCSKMCYYPSDIMIANPLPLDSKSEYAFQVCETIDNEQTRKMLLITINMCYRIDKSIDSRIRNHHVRSVLG